MKWLSFICAIALIAAVFPLPIHYYTFLRFLVTLCAISLAIKTYRELSYKIAILYIITAIIFNPILPVYLYNKILWIPIDILAGLLFLFYSLQNYINKSTTKKMEEIQIENIEEKDQITYHDYGFQSAEYAKSRPQAILNFLENVYEKFIQEQKLDAKGIKDRVAKLKAEVLQSKARKNETQAELTTNETLKSNKEKVIEELELEKVDIKNGDNENTDTIPFVIGAFITVLLTLYLFVFYSSSGYSAFYGVKEGSLGFINPNIFGEAKSGGVLALIILFPVIFLGLEFLIHYSLEKNKKNVIEGKPKKYLTIILLLSLTLIADAFIGYKISQGVHTNEFNSGLTSELWQYSMIFKDINFYLVLVLGFVVYVIWGGLLNYVLSHPYLKTVNERDKILIGNIDSKIDERRVELSAIVSKINSLSTLILTLTDEIAGKDQDIIGYENGVIPVNIPSFRAAVGEFMGGWGAYTVGAFRIKSKELLSDAESISNQWLEEKILSIKTEYSNGKF
ncbi:DUF6804 family protein [Flavobacterium sp. AG291]|uniref:DUF6804 family protein n=1 Tax=Flavobacterium sp. AG291 TaxID=2184000 RepID=UPI000E2AAD1E|nr:DUF6804 family protein [Flavobacterium sp. AG291]RDI14433.1 hypothetical protein DEU42_102126 [Flavobacterium sp. AG291]